MTFASERIKKDLESISLPDWIRLVGREELMLEFDYIPNEGPYEGVLTKLYIRFPINFPFDSPRLELDGNVRRMHPFVDPMTGAVCMDVLRLGWRPTIGIDTLVFGVALMLQDPLSLCDEDTVVLNEEALAALKKKKEK